MGRASGRRYDPSHELALLPPQPRRDRRASRAVDGRDPRLGRGEGGRRACALSCGELRRFHRIDRVRDTAELPAGALMSSLFTALKTQIDTPRPLAPDSADVDRQYRYWRNRILLTTIIGYALYYFVRSNISVPLKAMGGDLGYTKAQLG